MDLFSTKKHSEKHIQRRMEIMSCFGQNKAPNVQKKKIRATGLLTVTRAVKILVNDNRSFN